MKRAIGGDMAFALVTAVLLLVTHAVAYLIHEYAHSFTAWALGYMANPLALEYGGLTPGNLVFLIEVGDNVAYDPILKGGDGLAVAAIALAGPLIGNGLLYILLHALAPRLAARGPVAASFLFWMLLMCAANMWSYVPIRAITTHADIAIAAEGLGIGVLPLFPILLVPSLALVGHFFLKACPRFIPAIAEGASARTALMVALTGAWFFLLFGGIGFSGSYGPVSQAFSILSEALLMPLSVVWLWQRCSVKA
ncbi:hypothetical protein P6144_11025 [Sphingomonas sp. HITSZ_GF]|uniref:hypothetical protein n=1 Tax=Sphingomonas sp. HITSZ_GF TaxID=3037247 RepID=UPI00240D09E4|nr:hypothetical protein [Sphingomonas sp. HITSZ_GF]MDG2534183.1 hypothetical protein [Sphingomonas sp. HITSZ_GF]